MRKHPEAEASTPATCFVDEAAYIAFRQNTKELQKRCVNLLEVLNAEASSSKKPSSSKGISTSKGLEDAINDALE